MRKIGYLLFILFIFGAKNNVLHAYDEIYIGAQIIIEPGQSPEQIESWFRLLNENGMNVCRIRMFEDFMKTPTGEWDFSLFDCAFKAAEKYKVKIFATLFPSSKNNSIGGFKFPESEAHLEQIANYIEHVVSHFKTFPAMYAWVLINEPGTGGFVPQNAFTEKQFKAWKANQEKTPYNSKNYSLLVNFDHKKFLVDYNTWYLEWLAGEVNKYDAGKEIHVNNHSVFSNVAEYNFPAWRPFLTSLGMSAHPSWHFGYFNRSQYTMALAANCEIIRSGAGELPFWVTELQGGNNTYSGYNGFCPTAEETAQWLWTCIGAHTQGIIFWCFNPRSIGEEAGEWALLDFQNNPSDRLLAARKVIQTIASHKQLFAQAKAINSPITILYTRESLWAEKQVQYRSASDDNYEGRTSGGVIKSATAFFEILSENGIKSNFGEINEFDWNKSDYTGECIILAHQISIPSRYWEPLKRFVKKGGKLIIEGLTAFYDENMLNLNSTGAPLQEVFGGALSEVICIPGDFSIPYANTQMPVHLWKSYIHPSTGIPLATEGEHILAVRNQYGKGSAVYLPALAAMGAERSKNKTPLSDFLRKELKEQINQLPFAFATHQEGVIMQILQTGNEYITCIINKTDKTQKIEFTPHFFKPTVLFSDKKANVLRKSINIAPEETVIIHWK
jgi:beta-galactosidase